MRSINRHDDLRREFRRLVIQIERATNGPGSTLSASVLLRNIVPSSGGVHPNARRAVLSAWDRRAVYVHRTHRLLLDPLGANPAEVVMRTGRRRVRDEDHPF